MKHILSVLFVLTAVFAQAADKLIIDADQFEAYDDKGLSIFTGNVKLTKVKDRLNSDKLEVYMTPKVVGETPQKRVALKYIAIGNADFEIFTLDKHYIGKGDKVIYNPVELQYEIIGKGFLKEVTENKTLYGESIFLNQTTGEARVYGTKNKPVRFIMEIESKEKK